MRFRNLAPYVAGKTGTTDSENDGWFVGFTNDVTVAVWVGYDNADGKRRTLGSGQTGASVAVPIFEPIIQAVWASYAPKVALNGPSPDLKRLLVTRAGGRPGEEEYLRRDRIGNQLVGREDDDDFGLLRERQRAPRPLAPVRQAQPQPQIQQPWGGFFGWQQPQYQQQPQQQYRSNYNYNYNNNYNYNRNSYNNGYNPNPNPNYNNSYDPRYRQR